MTFVEKINHLMKSKGVSESDVVSRTEISYETLDSWCDGTAIPSTEEVIKLSRFFNVTPDYFIREDMTHVTALNEPQDFYAVVSNLMIWIAVAPNICWSVFSFIIFFVMYGWAGAVAEYGIWNFRRILENHAGIRMMFYPMLVAFVVTVLLFTIKRNISKPKGEKMTFSQKLYLLCEKENMSVADFAVQQNVELSSGTLPAVAEILRISDYFGVTADYLLRDEVNVIYRPKRNDSRKGIIFIILALLTVVLGIYMMNNFTQAVTTWFYFQGEFFTSQPKYPEYIAPVFNEYLPRAAVFTIATAISYTATQLVRKSDIK